jgi:transcriptional regulator with XRE-family HTH domain
MNKKVSLPENSNPINQRIGEVRKTLGYSQEKFGELLNLSRSHIGAIEADMRKVNDRLIKIIAITYAVNEDWLRDGIGAMFDEDKDPRLERIWQNFKKLDKLLQDCVLQHLDMIVDYQEKKDQGN